MVLTPRDFQGANDVSRVKAFLLGRELWPSLPDYWTAGKSTVGTFQTLFDSSPSHHKFWHDGSGNFHAYAWLCPEPAQTVEGDTNSWRMLIHPSLRTRELATAVLAYAEEQLLKLVGQGTTKEPMKTVAYERDSWLASLLEENGYTKQKALDVYMQRRLDDPIDDPNLASGYIIRPLDAQKDIVQRSGVQSDAFGGQPEPDDWSIKNTKRFIRWYVGREDLDLVAVSETGEIASFAVFLVDSGTGVGELDPVGTRTAYRRRGLSKAVLLSGLQYLRAKGMNLAAVRTGIDNMPAICLYESVGFSVVDQLYRYTKSTG